MPTGDYPPTNIYGRPLWQGDPQVPNYPYYPDINPTTGLPYHQTGFELKDACPVCGRSYHDVIRFENGNAIIALVEPGKESRRGGYGIRYEPDDYLCISEISDTGGSISFIKKKDCFGEYPEGHTECTDDCRLRQQCREQTYPHGKSDDPENDHPYCDEKWETWMREGVTVEAIDSAGSWTHEELDQIAEVLESATEEEVSD